MNPIAEAIKVISDAQGTEKSGVSPAALIAESLGVTPAAISKYKKLGRVPPGWAIPLEQLTDGSVSRHDTAPLYYPREGERA